MKPIRILVVAGAAVALSLAGASPALAAHSHVIRTPGACVDKGGVGFGTGEPHGPGDGPSFHSQVHKGTPGLFAFELPNNPVGVFGFATCP